ncbi:MAG TPA: Uma2 family endonuclease [Pirellulaceae bacterium]|nr:Uma2 family endonuclease [Pirellulaceae bacterium]
MTTAEQLATLASGEHRFELVDGQLLAFAPAGGRHGRVAARAAWLLQSHVDGRALGVVYAAETGFVLRRDPDTVRAPDAAFVSAARVASINDDAGFVPLSPDLAIEVVSPSDSFSAVDSKALSWLDAGTRLVLVLDPVARRVHAYRPPNLISIIDANEPLDASDVVPGWSLLAGDFFAG